VSLEKPIPIVHGRFSTQTDEVLLQGTFSATRPGLVEGSVEFHVHEFLGP
jgi:hypothetical protein